MAKFAECTQPEHHHDGRDCGGGGGGGADDGDGGGGDGGDIWPSSLNSFNQVIIMINHHLIGAVTSLTTNYHIWIHATSNILITLML